MDLSHKVKVLGARMVLKMDEAEEQTKSGIVLLESAKEPMYTGTVVSKGAGTRLINGTVFPMEVEIGDRVLYSRLAGVPTHIEGEEGTYLVINERDVLAIFPKE